MTGLTKVFKALDNIRDDAKLGKGGKIDDAVTNLIEMGEEAARNEYAASRVEGASDVRVSHSLTAHEATVTASGSDVLFVEFGTGVIHNYGSMKGAEHGFVPASWSTSDEGSGFLAGGRLSAFHGQWPIPGKPKEERWTEGHAPVNAMHHAAEKMKSEAGTYLRRAYK